MKTTFLVLSILLTMTTLVSAQTVSFDGDQYSSAWSDNSNQTLSVEFLRKGESVNDWNRMLTAKEFTGITELKGIVPTYFNNVKPLLALKPEFLKPKKPLHKDELIFVLTMLYPDKSNYEFVLARFYGDGDGPVRATIFSTRIKFSPEVSFDEIMKKRDRWLDELSALDIPVSH